MHNLAVAVVLTEQRHRQCPCGAAADRPHGLCRKCQARNAWRRKTVSPHRKASHRRFGRRARNVARRYADTFTGMEG